MVFIEKLERQIKKLITPKGKSFWCDGHVWLCIACTRIRSLLRKKTWKTIIIFTKKGLYSWNKKQIRNPVWTLLYWQKKWYRVPSQGGLGEINIL